MPPIAAYPLLRPSHVQRCREEKRVARPSSCRTEIVAAFDLKVASPLPVLRDPWRPGTALI